MIETLRNVLEEEIGLMTHIAKLQDQALRCVELKNWPDLEHALDSLQNVSIQLETLDTERERQVDKLRSDLGGAENESFLELVSRFSQEEQTHFLKLYRSVRVQAIRLKAGAGRLGYFVRVLSDSVRESVEELLPHRKGNLYSRSGRSNALREEAVVFDQEL